MTPQEETATKRKPSGRDTFQAMAQVFGCADFMIRLLPRTVSRALLGSARNSNSTLARALLTRRGIDHQLLVVGGLDEGEDGSVIEAIRFSGRQIIATGHVHHTRPHFQLMDIFCPPDREGFPNVVLESAASGVPAVTTDATGALDSVVTGTAGLIVAVGSATELADALEHLIVDESLPTHMGEAARIRVAAQFARADVCHRLNSYDVATLHS